MYGQDDLNLVGRHVSIFKIATQIKLYNVLFILDQSLLKK